jgi:hypothetical protein
LPSLQFANPHRILAVEQRRVFVQEPCQRHQIATRSSIERRPCIRLHIVGGGGVEAAFGQVPPGGMAVDRPNTALLYGS